MLAQNFRHKGSEVEELPYLARDRSYDFNYQETRMLSEEREILPGDSFQVVCTLKTKGVRQNMSVVGIACQ